MRLYFHILHDHIILMNPTNDVKHEVINVKMQGPVEKKLGIMTECLGGTMVEAMR